MSSEDTKKLSGNRIASARTRLNLTQGQVAAAVSGLSVTRLSNWERGLRMISVDEAKRLAPVLKVSAGYLLTLDDDAGDPREKALLDLYRHSDERGRATIFRIAEQESSFADSESEKSARSA